MTITQERNLQSKFEKHPIGFKKSLIQVGSTIEFETKRNFRNILISISISILFYLLGIIINLIREGRGVELYDNSASLPISSIV